jgi:myosin-crossreactive antigen
MGIKTFSITDELTTLLKLEPNQSGLICRLLRDHYAGITPLKAFKMEMSQLKDRQKLVKLSIENRQKYDLKMADLEDMKKEAGTNGLSEYAITSWERKWS